MYFLLRVSEWARLLNRKIGAAAPAASMKITLKVTNPLRTNGRQIAGAGGGIAEMLHEHDHGEKTVL